MTDLYWISDDVILNMIGHLHPSADRPIIILVAIVQSTPRCPERSGCEGICLFIQDISGIMNPPNNIQIKNYKAVFYHSVL